MGSKALFEKTYETQQKRKRKKHKNVEVITIGLKTAVTTLSQFRCPSCNYQVHYILVSNDQL